MSKKQARAVQHLQEGLAIHGAGRPEEALAKYQRAIGANPDLAAAHEARGIALVQLGRRGEALKSLNRAAGLDRANANILVNRGTVFSELGRPVEALVDFELAIALLPDSAAAHYGAGNALCKLGRLDEALEHFGRSLELQPQFAEAHAGRGVALAALGRRDEALESYGRALALNPARAESWFNRGLCMMQLRQFRAAADDFYNAINRDGDKAEYHLAAATACNEIGFFEDALNRVDYALELDQENLGARIQRGNVLQGLQRFAEAVEDFDRVLEFQPEDALTYCFRETAMRSIHLWREDGPSVPELHQYLLESPSVPSPFLILSLSADAALQKGVALRYAKPLEAAASPPLAPYARRERIRIGYFSADFHDHATMYLMAEMLERHDRERFEVTAFSFGPDDKSEWRARAQKSVDRFVDVRDKSDSEIAALARELEIDVAVDLKGFTLHARPFLFANRPAPVQVNYLGYPGTMGCSFFDYIIADPVLIPASHRIFYTEKIVSLPDSYQPNCGDQPIDPQPVTREDAGLPRDAVVFCSFNQSYKLKPEMFDLWMNILGRVDGSVLWTWVKGEEPRARLRHEAQKRGVDPTRLHFAGTLPMPQHLARLPLGDLFLDSVPYNAHTTASDALRMGLPVLTCPGEAFASRVAASLLTAAGLTELIAPTLEDYAELAVALGRDQERLAALRRKVAAQALTSPLFDSDRFVRHIESAFETMYQRMMDGLPADHIDVRTADRP